MPEMPEKKYLIGGAVVVAVLIAIIVPLAVLLPADDNDGSPPEASSTSSTTSTSSPSLKTPMKRMLDAMQELMTGDAEYDPELYENIRGCMNHFEKDLPAAHDGTWQGMIDYWNTNGTEGDWWGSSTNTYMEFEPTETSVDGMLIYEPCNYASNLAYYFDLLELCQRSEMQDVFYSPEYMRAFGIAFSEMAVGSCFWHGSSTSLGNQQDNMPISIVAYLIHQGSLSSIPDASSILTDLSETHRPYTALELADEFYQMHLTMPVTEWFNKTKTLEFPNYYLIFTGLFSTAMTIAFDDDAVNEYVPILGEIFGVPETYVNFTLYSYLPELREAMKGIEVSDDDKRFFLKDTLGAVAKLVYSLMWQEEVLTNPDVENPLLLNETINIKGWEFLPKLNSLINAVNSFSYEEKKFQIGRDVYPGEDECNPTGPHAKWHLESAIGLLDLVYVGDEMRRVIGNETLSEVKNIV